MPENVLKFIKRCAEWRPREEMQKIPKGTRGIYSLLKKKGKNKYNVVYVGMANGKGGIRDRIISHSKSKHKRKRWTHFSIFKVRTRVTKNEIAELETLLRYIYRKDRRANSLNLQRSSKKFKKVRNDKLEEW